MLIRESQSLLNNAIDTFIHGIDNWAVKAMAGGPQIRSVIGELLAIRKQGPRMINDAFADLKKVHASMMGHELPHTTAALGPASGKMARKEVQAVSDTFARKKTNVAASSKKKLVAKKSKDATKNTAAPNTSKTNTKKKAEKREKYRSNGIPAEHITDYHVKGRHITYQKVNNGGVLTEEHSTPHHGLDHLWSNPTNERQPFIVGETKSSIFDSFSLIAVLPAEMKEKFKAFREYEAANPTTNNNKPNIFENEQRDEHADQIFKVDRSGKAKEVRRGLNKPNKKTKLATQMSHTWICENIKKEKLTTSGIKIKKKIAEYEIEIGLNPNALAPYKRWICLVTGRQITLHKNSGGSNHHIQIILDLPDNIIKK